MENQKGHNNKKTKTIILSICALLAVGIGVFLTYSYLNTYTGQVTNTFVVGGVTASLDELCLGGNGRQQVFSNDNNTTLGSEPKFNETLIPQDNLNGYQSSRVPSNTFRLYTNTTYFKDPTLHINATGSATKVCIFLEVHDTSANSFSPTVEALLTTNPQKVGSNKFKWEKISEQGWHDNANSNCSYYYCIPATDSSQNNKPATLEIANNKETTFTLFNNLNSTADVVNGNITIRAAVIDVTTTTPTLQELYPHIPNEFFSPTT